MILGGFIGDVQGFTDFFVGATLQQQLQNLILARCELGYISVGLIEQIEWRIHLTCEHQPNRRKQFVAFASLGDKAGRTAGQCLAHHLRIGNP